MTNYYGLFPDVLILVCCVPKNQTKADFQVLNHSYWISIVKKHFKTWYNYLPAPSCVLTEMV